MNVRLFLFFPTLWRSVQVQLRPELVAPRSLLDLRVRRALAHAVDKQALNDALFEGQGIMSEAVQEFTRYAFETFDLVRIYAQPFAENTASARVLEKAGFTCEGRLRANVLKDGKVLDTLLFARVEPPVLAP